MKDVIIISPHIDDEAIGVYSVITNPEIRPIIIYTEDTTNERKEEALKLKNYVNIKAQLFCKNIPNSLLHKDNIYYFPYHITETHFAHRLQGYCGEQLARAGYNVIFYSINMNANFIYEVKEPNKKKKLLDDVYPSQKSLWNNDGKYYLFEGYCQWLYNGIKKSKIM